MTIKVLIVLAAHLLCMCAAQEDKGRRTSAVEWNVWTYPNPVTEYARCGRPSPSFLCDPNGILSEVEADRIDDVLKEIYNQTTIPLRCYDTQGSKRKGYLVMVAVLKKLQMRPGVRSFAYRYFQAQLFSYRLNMHVWRHSECGEATLIFYSFDDDLFYIITQPVAREKLTDEIVININMEALTIYRFPWQQNRVFGALKYVADHIKEVFRN